MAGSGDNVRCECDWHVHSERREMKFPALAKAAQSAGLSTIGIVDHVFRADHRLRSRAKIIDRLPIDDSLKVCYGAEVDVFAPGKVAHIPSEYLPVDYVLLSFTHLRPGYTAYEFLEDPDRLVREIYQLFLTATSQKGVFGIAHPFSIDVSIGSDEDIMNFLTVDEFVAGIDMAVKNDIAFELNAMRIPKHFESQMRFLELCRDRGAQFFVGSDAHALEDFATLQNMDVVLDRLELKSADLVVPVIG